MISKIIMNQLLGHEAKIKTIKFINIINNIIIIIGQFPHPTVCICHVCEMA